MVMLPWEFASKEEAIASLIAKGEDDWIEFDGQNCNDYLGEDDPECMGWDGESRRCDCGNRRVFAYATQNSNGTWSAYAEAY